MQLVKFISEYWQIVTVLCSIIGYLYAQMVATRRGIRALLRADIVRLYNKYHEDLKYCPIFVKDALDDEYKQYHALRGNGVGTKLYEQIMDLPTEPPKE